MFTRHGGHGGGCGHAGGTGHVCSGQVIGGGHNIGLEHEIPDVWHGEQRHGDASMVEMFTVTYTVTMKIIPHR